MSTTHPQVRDTEWDALQRKFGNLPKLPPVVTEEQLTREVVDAAEQVDTLALKSLEELEELEDEVEESVLSRYRQQRVAQLRQKQRLERYGPRCMCPRFHACIVLFSIRMCRVRKKKKKRLYEFRVYDDNTTGDTSLAV